MNVLGPEYSGKQWVRGDFVIFSSNKSKHTVYTIKLVMIIIIIIIMMIIITIIMIIIIIIVIIIIIIITIIRIIGLKIGKELLNTRKHLKKLTFLKKRNFKEKNRCPLSSLNFKNNL